MTSCDTLKPRPLFISTCFSYDHGDKFSPFVKFVHLQQRNRDLQLQLSSLEEAARMFKDFEGILNNQSKYY